jgi:hypothetical protein
MTRCLHIKLALPASLHQCFCWVSLRWLGLVRLSSHVVVLLLRHRLSLAVRLRLWPVDAGNVTSSARKSGPSAQIVIEITVLEYRYSSWYVFLPFPRIPRTPWLSISASKAIISHSLPNCHRPSYFQAVGYIALHHTYALLRLLLRGFHRRFCLVRVFCRRHPHQLLESCTKSTDNYAISYSFWPLHSSACSKYILSSLDCDCQKLLSFRDNTCSISSATT